ncbi:MAG TPA: glycosyltransferase family 4 protein [Tepidisphaeraceae bacterium]|jgi:glycosyltransferase involved in cell wall biosynthesis|nr:glycosyltransferase family 4 protein [Tepidisphaeraceae bacterium]
MRITFLLPFAGTAGGTRVVATYADLFQSRGHTVTVVSTPRPDPGLKKKIRSFLTGKGWHKPLGPSHLAKTKVDHRIIDRYRPITDADVPDADVVIATWWETAEWVAKLSSSKGKKIYFCQHHEVVFDGQPVDRVAATWRLPMQKIVCAQWLADVARDEYNDPTAICVMNSVEHNLFHAPPRSKQPQPTVGLMYSAARFKGCDIALASFTLARQSVPNLKLIAFGAGQPSPDLPLPAGADFHHNPPQEKIRELYAAADAWLVVSRCEGFGMPILEAMACRTPVIATPTGAAPQIVNSTNGLLVKLEDPTSVAHAITHIAMMNDTSWRAMSESAHATAAKYTWESATQKFESALTQFLSK